MADKFGVVNKYKQVVQNIGRSAISSVYPNDFEFYLCAFELVSGGKTVDYFVFPIQPSSIQKSEPVRANIKTSMSGVTVLKNSSFIPQEISLKGNFGRNFKILSSSGVAFGFGEDSGWFNKSINSGTVFPNFSVSIKTGYGAIKLLQSIIHRSNTINKVGELYQLYFYNMALGESYLVTSPPSGNIFSQSEDQNMIWSYSVNLSIISPLENISKGVKNKSRSKDILKKNIISDSLNIVAKEVSYFLTKNNGVTRIAGV